MNNKQAAADKRKKYDRIVITAFNNRFDFFRRGETLIASLHRTSFDIIDKIYVFNLGLSKAMISRLNQYEKVEVLDFPSELNDIYEGFLAPRQFAWKCYALQIASEYGEIILWMDAGIAALKPLDQIFNLIENEEIFFVDNGAGLFNKDWTHEYCLEYMKAGEEEKNGLQVSANIIGYKASGKYRHIIDEAYELSKIKEVICDGGLKHRHDQSIFSILSIRYACKRYPFELYGEYKGIMSDKQVCWAHRGNMADRSGIRLKPDRKKLGISSRIVYLYNNLRIGTTKTARSAAKRVLQLIKSKNR